MRNRYVQYSWTLNVNSFDLEQALRQRVSVLEVVVSLCNLNAFVFQVILLDA